ncbi:MAG TPA: carboxypeptidase regulatory-like domain-containing protein, partial [Thermoanaerobaculia bacterium]
DSDVDGEPIRTVIADAKGAFHAGGIVPGTFTVSASHPLYRNQGLTLPVAEAAKLSRQIAMTPFGRITGTVVDEQRKPVGGAVVASANRGATVTSPDGKFSLLATPMLVPVPNITVTKPGYAALQSGPHNVPEGETKNITLTLARGVPLVVKVVDRDAAPLVNEPVFLMHARDEAAGGRGSVPCAGLDPRRCRTDAKGTVQFQLPAGKYDISAGGENSPVKQLPLQTIDAATGTITITLERGVPVEGTVTFSDGSPLTGDIQWAVVNRSSLASRTLVKEDGTFVLKNAPAGPITLHAMSEWLRVEGPSKEITAPATGITLTVPKLARIEGKVVDRSTSQPVREFNVTTQSQLQGGRPGAKGTQVQADDGAYVLENVPPGTLDVVVTAAGYVPGTVANVVVAEGKTVSGVDVQLDRGATIVGRVTAGGVGLAEVMVTPSVMPDQRNPGNRSTRTDANGDYTLQGVAAGERAVDFWKDGYMSERKSVTATAGKESRLDVELSRGRELRGRVTDNAGHPVLAARVRPQAMGFGGMAMRTVMTDAEGGFVLQGLSSERRLTVFVDKEGYLSKTLENVDPNGPALTVTLDTGGSLTGRVVGVPETEMTFVQVVATGGRTRGNARPDAQGNFTIQGVPDGQVTVYATQHQPRMRRTAQQVIAVANGTAPSVTLEFGTGVTLRGRVTRGGAPLEVGMLDFRLATQPGMPGVTTTIGRGGTYELGMDPGTYRIWVNGPGLGRIEAGEVTVTGSTTHDIELRGASLRGRVVDAATGTAISGATVRLERPVAGAVPFAPRQERTDSNGAFTIDLLADATYRLRTSAERYATDSQDVVVGGGAAADLLVQLRPGDRVGVRVVDASDGRAVPSSSVTVTDERNAIVYSGMPPRDNEDVMLLWLLPGRYKVRVYSAGYGSGSADLPVPGPTVTIPVQRAGRIVVQTTRAGLRARLLDATSRVMQGAQIPQGTFENIPAGSYTIEIIDAHDVVVHRAPVNVVAGQTSTVVYE